MEGRDVEAVVEGDAPVLEVLAGAGVEVDTLEAPRVARPVAKELARRPHHGGGEGGDATHHLGVTPGHVEGQEAAQAGAGDGGVLGAVEQRQGGARPGDQVLGHEGAVALAAGLHRGPRVNPWRVIADAIGAPVIHRDQQPGGAALEGRWVHALLDVPGGEGRVVVKAQEVLAVLHDQQAKGCPLGGRGLIDPDHALDPFRERQEGPMNLVTRRHDRGHQGEIT